MMTQGVHENLNPERYHSHLIVCINKCLINTEFLNIDLLWDGIKNGETTVSNKYTRHALKMCTCESTEDHIRQNINITT